MLIEAAQAQRAPTEVAYIPAEHAALQGLGRVYVALVQGVAARGKGRGARLDHDATIQERHTRQTQWHGKGGRGYQPAAMDNLRLIQRGLASLPATVTEYDFRADSACDDARVLKWLANA